MSVILINNTQLNIEGNMLLHREKQKPPVDKESPSTDWYWGFLCLQEVYSNSCLSVEAFTLNIATPTIP
jgi:hypothetical protein